MITAACFMSSAWMRSKTSWLEWWVRVSYSISSWMNWKPGRPMPSNDWWSVPPVLEIVSVVAPISRNGWSHLRKIGRTASLPWR